MPVQQYEFYDDWYKKTHASSIKNTLNLRATYGIPNFNHVTLGNQRAFQSGASRLVAMTTAATQVDTIGCDAIRLQLGWRSI